MPPAASHPRFAGQAGGRVAIFRQKIPRIGNLRGTLVVSRGPRALAGNWHDRCITIDTSAIDTSALDTSALDTSTLGIGRTLRPPQGDTIMFTTKSLGSQLAAGFIAFTLTAASLLFAAPIHLG